MENKSIKEIQKTTILTVSWGLFDEENGNQ